MIADKFVDLYARNAGLRDKLVAERDVVLTYALDALIAGGVMGDGIQPSSSAQHARRRDDGIADGVASIQCGASRIATAVMSSARPCCPAASRMAGGTSEK